MQAWSARAWYHERFEIPYLRDELLDAGIMVNTLETALDPDGIMNPGKMAF